MKLVLAITGASGVELSLKFAEVLKKSEVELSVVISENAKKVFELEAGMKEVEKVFSEHGKVFENSDFSSELASGSSFDFDGMIILPCSMKTLACIAHGLEVNLICRAASVCLKEGKKLVLCPRETPLRTVYIENMLKLSREGAIILPLMMSFYLKEKSYQAIVNNIFGKILKVFGLKFDAQWRWEA